MQEENIRKMTEMADTVIKDLPTLNILLCYLLHRVDRPVETDQLYEIAMETEMISYFSYQDSIKYLTENGLIDIGFNREGKECFFIKPKGQACAEQLKSYAPKSCRDKAVLVALKYFARLKYEQEIKIEYIPSEQGCYINVRCIDSKYDLMDMKLFAPDLEQAKLVGRKIMLNPAGFYGKIIDFVLSNEEVTYDLTDN
ncbi:MAG: DUF4364 family protein [Ruminococcus sp.]|nr:DUF4364 family protein [Ruminococcus sp.]